MVAFLVSPNADDMFKMVTPVPLSSHTSVPVSTQEKIICPVCVCTRVRTCIGIFTCGRAYTCVGQRTTSGITSQSLVTTVLSFKTRPHVLECTQEARVGDLQTPGIPTPPPALEIKS